MSSESYEISDLNETYYENKVVDTDSVQPATITDLSVEKDGTLYMDIDLCQKNFYLTFSPSKQDRLLSVFDQFYTEYDRYPKELQELVGFQIEGKLSSDMSSFELTSTKLDFDISEGESPSTTSDVEYTDISEFTEMLLKQEDSIKAQIEEVVPHSDDEFSVKIPLKYDTTLTFTFNIAESTEDDVTTDLIEKVGNGRVEFLENETVYITPKQNIASAGFHCGTDTTDTWYIYPEESFQKRTSLKVRLLYLGSSIINFIHNFNIIVHPRTRKKMISTGYKVSVQMIFFAVFFHSSKEFLLTDSFISSLGDAFFFVNITITGMIVFPIGIALFFKFFTEDRCL